jgi:hypothetical protein
MRAVLRAIKAARRNARPAPAREFLYLFSFRFSSMFALFRRDESGEIFFFRRGMTRFYTHQLAAASRKLVA